LVLSLIALLLGPRLDRSCRDLRGYGATQTTYAVECAIDDLARLLNINPFKIRRINKVRETDRRTREPAAIK
jgi:CO/xanthine dehydrogenase Mo-binding subunit